MTHTLEQPLRIQAGRNSQPNPTSCATRRHHDWVIVGLLALGACLLLTNLQSGYLWEDEAETALLARQTLAVGYPKATDGRNAIEITTHGYGPGDSWVYNPWLPFYVLAGVFALFGESTRIARLPFALCGLLSLYLTWRLARRVTPDVRVQRLSVALVTCSVPFLLHMRQCRYYAPTTALLLGVCLAYLAFLESPSRRRAIGLGVLLALLFHTNFGAFIPTCGALLLHQAWQVKAAARRWLGECGLVALALTAPWAVFFYRSAFIGTVSWHRIAQHLQYYIRVTNKYLAPIALMAAVSVGWRLIRLARRRRDAAPQPSSPHPWRSLTRSTQGFFAIMVAAQLVFLLIPDQRHLRYLMPMLPLFAIGEACWLIGWVARHRVVGAVLIALALLTTTLHTPHHPQAPLIDFAGELTHHYTGPMEGIVGYLEAHAQPEEVVKIPYDDRTLMFYTRMRVERPSQFLDATGADWVVLRRDWTPDHFPTSPLAEQLDRDYDRIELDAPDIRWQNREDPGSHHYRTVRDAPRIVLYHKRTLRHGPV